MEGNFFLKPNGVFLVRDGKAEVVDTADYQTSMGVTYAVQSGPLLLKNGKTHPVFKGAQSSGFIGTVWEVRKDRTVVLVITEFRQEKYPTLHDFAELFRSLGCEDALYLDGVISLMRGAADLTKKGNPFASMIAVVAENDQ